MCDPGVIPDDLTICPTARIDPDAVTLVIIPDIKTYTAIRALVTGIDLGWHHALSSLWRDIL